MQKMSFKSWMAEMMAVAGQNPAMDAAKKDPTIKNASAQAVKAASDAIRKGKNPLDAAKNTILQQAQMGKLNLKDLGKVMPQDADQGQKPGQQ